MLSSIKCFINFEVSAIPAVIFLLIQHTVYAKLLPPRPAGEIKA